MVYIDKAYYDGTFHGTAIPQEDFDRIADMASDLIDGIAVVPFVFAELEEAKQLCVKRATAYQTELLYLQGGVDAIVGMSAQAADSEQLGAYGITKGATASSSSSKVVLPTVFGIPVSEMAVQQLRKAGLMARWAYTGIKPFDGGD
ncbi:MAG: hypothetical protein RSC06_00820 [Clostridia bacterium]